MDAERTKIRKTAAKIAALSREDIRTAFFFLVKRLGGMNSGNIRAKTDNQRGRNECTIPAMLAPVQATVPSHLDRVLALLLPPDANHKG